MDNKESVYDLIKSLCISVYNDHQGRNSAINAELTATSAPLPPRQPTQKFLKKSKSLAYEILLHKSVNPKVDTNNEDVTQINPFKELDIYRLQLLLSAKNFLDKKRCAQFNDCYHYILSNEWFQNSQDAQNILHFLLKLQDSVANNSANNSRQLNSRNKFALRSSNEYTEPYSLIPIEMLQFTDEEMAYCDRITLKSAITNPYLPTYLTKRFIDRDSDGRPIERRNFCQLPEMLVDKTKENSPKRNKNHLKLNKIVSPVKMLKLQPPQSSPIVRWGPPYCLSWDQLGVPRTMYSFELPFCIDVPQSSLHLLAISDHNRYRYNRHRGAGSGLNARIIDQSLLIDHLKYLLCGIESETFSYNSELMIFEMLDSVTVATISPQVMNSFLQEFLECGSCYARLQCMCTKSEFRLRFDGFIFQSLCASVDKYLSTFSRLVNSYDDETILKLFTRIEPMFRQIRILSTILGLHPMVPMNREMPLGSNLLEYLYKEITDITDQDVSILFVYILKQCCRVYFRYFEKWIFHGTIVDPHKELFIEFNDLYRPNTKYFWDKAYQVKRESVPGFLHGFEDMILLCGKYTKLLKAFKPYHPLLSLKNPGIEVCLTSSQTQKVQERCRLYAEHAQSVCGEPISVTAVFQEKENSKKQFLRLVAEKFTENLNRWKDEQVELALTIQMKREQDRIELQKQIEEIRERKIQSKLETIAMEQEYLRLEQKVEDERLLKEMTQRQKTIDYYTELGEMIDSQRQQTEELIRDLKKQLTTNANEDNVVNNSSNTPLSAASTSSTKTEAATATTDRTTSGGSSYVTAREYETTDGGEEFTVAVKNSNTKIELMEQSIEDDNQNKNLSVDFCDTEKELQNMNKVDNELVSNDNYKASMKKSASDYFNSNEALIETITNATLNKQKVLGSTLQLTTTTTTTVKKRNKTTKSLTDAQKNKFKLLEQDNFTVGNDNIDFPEEPIIKDTNSNVIDTEIDQHQSDQLATERQKNKLKAMGHHEYDLLCPTIQVDMAGSLPSTSKIANVTALTDLQRNRQKVLNDEFGFNEMPNIYHPPTNNNDEFLKNQKLAASHQLRFGADGNDMPSTEPNELLSMKKPLTELERNRQRVMTEEFGGFQDGQTKIQHIKKKVLSLELEAGFERNKLHAMESSIGTPMSTGSDTPILSERIEDDIKNANTQPIKSTLLKINTNIPKYCGIPSNTALVNQTPESALNTAGLLAKDGFIFRSISPSGNETIIPSLKDYQLINKNNQQQCFDGDQIFKSNFNFESETQKKFFPLNISTSPSSSSLNKEKPSLLENSEDNINELSNYLNISTITNSLKMSFVLPMQAHLNVLNNEILRIYLIDFDILSHFKSLRNYFFMMDGEFASYICDNLIEKLELGTKPAELLKFSTLHSMLDQALGSSIIGNDKNAENLSFIVDDYPDEFNLNGVNVLKILSLTYSVKWPLNLLLNPETIVHYAKIFQHLLKLRRIRWMLDKSYELLKEPTVGGGGGGGGGGIRAIFRSRQYTHIHLIRNKLLNFVNALQNHITANALQASWRRFKNDLELVKSMEDLYQTHTKYLKRVEFLCMLNKQSFDFYLRLEDIFTLSLRFYQKLKSRNWKEEKTSHEFIHPNFGKFVIIEQDFHKIIKYIIHSGSKMSRRGYQTEIKEFINLINFNGYYDSDSNKEADGDNDIDGSDGCAAVIFNQKSTVDGSLADADDDAIV